MTILCMYLCTYIYTYSFLGRARFDGILFLLEVLGLYIVYKSCLFLKFAPHVDL